MNEQLTEPAPQAKTALSQMSERLNVSQKLLVDTLKQTAFKGCKTDEQFASLMIVANEYKLNPFLKEIYAFPGKGGEIVPIVSIDGWLRIINSHPQFDGLDEEFSDDGNTCKITLWRKDRSRPVVHTELLSEVRRNTEPWKQHTRRMLKWKTLIQAARIAFGFGGIFDEDEGKSVSSIRDVTPKSAPTSNPFLPVSADEEVPGGGSSEPEAIEPGVVSQDASPAGEPNTTEPKQ